MDASKEGLIQRLLMEGKITQDEAYLLRRKESPIAPEQLSVPIEPLPQLNKWLNPQDRWMNEEMNRRARIAEACPCNPANGGSGICGCVLTGPIVTC